MYKEKGPSKKYIQHEKGLPKPGASRKQRSGRNGNRLAKESSPYSEAFQWVDDYPKHHKN